MTATYQLFITFGILTACVYYIPCFFPIPLPLLKQPAFSFGSFSPQIALRSELVTCPATAALGEL